MRFPAKPLQLTLALALSASVVGSLGCTSSSWCADCDKATPIMGLNYQPTNTYGTGTAIAVNPPNPSGGTPALYEVVSGTLPPGLTLDPATGRITGTPTAPGVYAITIRATNGANVATQTIEIVVASSLPLVVEYPTPQTFPAAAAIDPQAPILVEGTPGISTSYAVTGGTLPAGLMLNADGSITGTPTAPGIYSFTVTATNGARTASETLAYTITPAGSLGLAYGTPRTFLVGTAVPTQPATLINQTPGITSSYAVTSGSFPAGLTLNPSTGDITGTPSAIGSYTFVVTATNGSRSIQSSVTYIVTPTVAVTLSYPTPRTFIAATAISAQAPTLTNLTPGVVTTFVVSGGTLPAGLTLNADGTISGTPTTPGVSTFSVTATNGARTAVSSQTYIVTSASAMTVSYPSPQTFVAGTAISGQAPTLGNVTPGLTTTYALTSGTLPAGLTLNADGTITGTPTTSGVYSFTVTATNGARTAAITPSYIVTPAAPLTVDYGTPGPFTAGGPISLPAPAVTNPTPGLTTTYAVTSGTLPPGVTLNADGTLTGTPTTPGVYNFTVTATNGGRTATSTLSFVVPPAAALTVGYTTPQTFTAGTPITAQSPSVANETPGVTTTYAVTSGALPAGLTLNADGTLTGTATAAGVYAFTIMATNGTRTATASPTYIVTPAAALAASYSTPQTFTAGTLITGQIPSVANETPGLTTTYALTGGALPAGLTLNADGSITGTPTVPGVYSFAVTATNGARTALASSSYTVTPAAALTVSYTTPQTFPANTMIAAQSPTIGNATPGVSTTYAVTSGTLPTGLTLNADGTITGIPTAPGTYAFTVTATNGTRTATGNASYTINVAAPTSVNYATPVTYTSGFAIPQNSPSPSGGTPSSYTVGGGSLPPGLTLDPNTGVISGTPTASGSFSVTINATNTAGGVNQTLSITVLQAMSASFSANPSLVSVGQSSSLTPLFSGGTGTVDQSIGAVTSGGGIPTGVYSGTGTYTYTLTVVNSAGATLTRTAVVTVVNAPVNSVDINVPSGGTTTTVNNPSDPLNGLTVTVPNQGSAVCNPTTLTVTREVGQSLPGSLATGVIAVSDPWTFSSTVGYPFRIPITVTLPYDNSSLSGSDLPVPFYWDPAYAKWVSTGFKSIDTTNHLVTFTTLLPGQYAVLAIPGLSGALSTQSLGFANGTDSWFQPNQGVFDIPGSAGLGMSSFASWYFNFKKSSNGNAGLFSQFLQGVANSAADDVNARALISRLGNGTLESWNQLWTQGAYSLTNVQTGLALITGLRVTGQPQIFFMSEARPATDNAMATLITGYDLSTNKFGVLDPNYPGMPLTITWNSGTGAFTSYDRAAGYVPTFTQYAFDGQTSIHRLSDYERVFNGTNEGWTNPPYATIAVADVSAVTTPTSGTYSVPSASNVTVSGSVTNGDINASHIYWSQNGGAKTPVALSSGAFSFTIPALADPYGTRISLETTANPCDPTFASTGYTEFNAKETGRTPWFPNICFESGSTNPWTLQQGGNSGIGYPASVSWNPSGDLNNYAISWTGGSVDSAIVNVGNDANVPSISQVYDGTSAFRVNNAATGAHISRLYQTITVPMDVSWPKLSFFWAAVMQNAGHSADQQPFVDILVEDMSVTSGGIPEVVYYKHFYANDPSYPGWIPGNGAGATQWYGINWQQVTLANLIARKGHNLRILIMAADCNQGGHGGYAYLDGVSCN
ncbi:putative Ig domain-containing protein [Geothrix sp. 21YS21S-4]|uniref:beta strand repeat-containing protein n=1 Tax=Geothrix sp. 21YS21S-4 TaxID=3068889 RepID=UPI0027B9FF61|nr:putative Ig domain-containing protein [Geothrix sp. 21YS21S-4]